MNSNFAEYKTEKDGNKLTIGISKYKVPKINKLMLVGVGIYLLFMLFSESSDVPDNYKFFFFLAVFGSIAIGIFIAFFLLKKINGNNKAKQKIIIDKEKKELSCPIDNFSAKFEDIKDVKIQEVSILGSSSSKLKLILSSGEKTLNFPIDTYNRAEEFSKLIKDNLS